MVKVGVDDKDTDDILVKYFLIRQKNVLRK